MCSGRVLHIVAGQNTRAICVTAWQGDKILDQAYFYATGKDAEGNYSAADLKLYKRVRQKIEAALWTDNMSNLQKLQAVADYICSTAHYPYQSMIGKEGNPSFWKDWSVPGDDKLYMNLYYYKNDVILNRIMDLQGGICTCIAEEIIETVASEDLNLPYLYSKDETGKDIIASGEGYWQAIGSASSNPSAGDHRSVIYQDSQGKRCFIDAQGLMTGTSETHDCKKNLISLK